MKDFRYYRGDSLEEALELVDHYRDARVLAGGTDILPGLRRGEGPEALVDISSLKELSYCKEEKGFIKLGALTTHEEIKASPLLKREAKALALAAASIGSPLIRNRGTVGGNLCYGSPAADTIPALLALKAKLSLKRRDKEREIPLLSFFKGPYETDLLKGEILTEISFPTPAPQSSSFFYKIGRRQALAISRISLAVFLTRRDDGAIEEIRIAPGAITPKPALMESAANLLKGERPTPSLIEKALELVEEEVVALTGIRPSSSYKRPVIKVITRRAMEMALGRG